jgi:hypothetical protein
MRRCPRFVALAAAALSLSVASCVSTNEVGGSDRASPTTAAPPTVVGVIGEDVTNGGVKAAVLDIEPFDQSPQGVPRVRIVMRAENLSSSVQENPDVQLTCAESATNHGDWYLGSTWEPTAGLPVNAVTVGEVIMGFPIKGDNPEYPVVTCSSPVLRVVMTDARTDEVTVVNYAVDERVTEMAAKAPRGPSLPLPAESS